MSLEQVVEFCESIDGYRRLLAFLEGSQGAVFDLRDARTCIFGRWFRHEGLAAQIYAFDQIVPPECLLFSQAPVQTLRGWGRAYGERHRARVTAGRPILTAEEAIEALIDAAIEERLMDGDAS